jgi:hypothetical protein
VDLLGWLKSILQSAFYQVIAQAVIFVFGTLLNNFLDNFRCPAPTGWSALSSDRVMPCPRPVDAVATNSLFRACGESAVPRLLGSSRCRKPDLTLPPT